MNIASLLQCNDMTRRTFQRRIGEINLQMLWQIAPPIAQLQPFSHSALVRARRGQFLVRIVQMDLNLIEDFGEAAHLDEARDGMGLFG
jgi:hypothetical protein